MNPKGKQSIEFKEPPFLQSWASIVGDKEGEGPLGKEFDQVIEDPYFGEKTWELAEARFMHQTALLAIQKAGITKREIRYVFAGDLLEQNMSTTFGVKDLKIPLFGLFGACSTAGESIALASMTVAGGYADYALALASSHIGSAEKTFRFPLEYGSQRPLSATWTVTGAGGFVVSKKKSRIKIRGITTGKIVDYGCTDSMNMGACMAPAAADVIYQSMQDFGMSPKDYDAVITGDLGEIGSKILKDLLMKNGYDLEEKHKDCGLAIYEDESQDTHAGGSGCACSAVVLAGLITKRIASGRWKRVLFVPTGALISKVSFNEGESVPGIAHGILFESEGI
ncbi:MAG: stage V sporulation protein AD [Anaerostipes sp.]|nr:stage V sporulation protein AD [Anaerostipes sp.]